jgi:hypothetical protein
MNENQNSKLSCILDRVSYHAVYDKSIIDALEYAHTVLPAFSSQLSRRIYLSKHNLSYN